MKLASLIDEKFGLPGNPGRKFGEKFMKEFIIPGNFAELWTAFETTYPELQPELQATFEKTNELLSYIKPEKGDESYRVSQMDEAAAQELSNLLDDALETLEFVSSQNETPSKEMVIPVIKDFDNIFDDMLMIFTSNTAGDKPLDAYKQTDIGFKTSQSKERIREIIKESLNELEDDNKINYTEFFKEIIQKLQQLDISIDYLSSAMTGKSPWDIGVDQDSVGRMATATKSKVKEQIKEVIKREIKSLKNSH